MQSSVRSETPRQVTISANPSSVSVPVNGGLQIDREVVVTSHTKHPGRRTSPSRQTTYSNQNGHARSHSEEPRRAGLNRPESYRLPERSMKRQSRQEMGSQMLRDTSRDNMKALAEFLMTKEPPPNNWMSIHSDDEMSLRTMKKFKVFGSLKKKKKKKRVSKSPKFMQLPDTAVAATTLQGCRHIAISIPLEHDYPELFRSSAEPDRRPKSAPRLYTTDRGTVTVLKPVAEVRESLSFSPSQGNSGNSVEIGRLRATSVATPPIEVLGVEATRTLERYYLQLHRQQQRAARADGKRPVSRGRTFLTDSPVSPKPDQRNSNGTVYSNATSATILGHSREVSSISTAPSDLPNLATRPDLSPLISSNKPTLPTSIVEEMKFESTRMASPLEHSKSQPPLASSDGSLRSDSSAGQTVLATGTAEMAMGYHSPGPQYFSRSNTPLASSAAPTKKLPDLPVGPDGLTIRPSTSISSRHRASPTGSPTGSRQVSSPTSPTHQSRQERVKARKQRDVMAAAIHAPQVAHLDSSIPTKHSRGRASTAPSATPKRAAKISVTPIMLVANLLPFTGLVLPSDLPSPSPSHRMQMLVGTGGDRANSSSTPSDTKTHTPPHSIHEIELDGDDSDTIPSSSKSYRKDLFSGGVARAKSLNTTNTSTTHNNTNSNLTSLPNTLANPTITTNNNINSTLETRRQERRAKRNMTLHEKELDIRLSRIEKDNRVLLCALRGIAGSFGELGRLGFLSPPGGGVGVGGVGIGEGEVDFREEVV